MGRTKALGDGSRVSNIKRAERSPIMPLTLPQSVKKLLQDKAYGHVVTFNAQGKPQLTMVWMDVDGDEVTFNTAEGRNKPRNLRRDPRIIVSVQDRNDPQAYVVFHGKGRVTEPGADDHIDKLAKRFLNADKYPFRRPGEKRLVVRISVDRIGGFGPKMQPWS
jgi:PPOX class probable F420-dependent enzyme